MAAPPAVLQEAHAGGDRRRDAAAEQVRSQNELAILQFICNITCVGQGALSRDLDFDHPPASSPDHFTLRRSAVSPAYIPRALEPVLRRAAREFPAVVLTGPRQSGKTTLLKRLFGRSHRYVSLDLPDVSAAAASDPRGFLDSFSAPVILDEIQHAPVLLPYIKEQIDSDRGRTGRFLLSGSQNLLLMERVTESLAGRTAVLRLLPFSRREISGNPKERFPWERRARASKQSPVTAHELWRLFLRGGYPELVTGGKRDISLWHSSYIRTYMERDVRGLRQIGDLTQFQSFLRATTVRSAQLFNMSDLARDLGVAVNTVKGWLSVLEATHQIVILRPYFANVGKRLVKTPKVYFTDVGTLCHLAGLKDPEHAASGPMGGAILETAVLSEIMKTFCHRGIDPKVYFWRTSSGTEVDFIVDTGTELVPIEVKLTSTPLPAMARGIEEFRRVVKSKATRAFLVHPGNVELPLGRNVSAIPFFAL
jgi:predicted AAA+ superfamily ATPase